MERNSPKMQPTDHISTGVEYSCNQKMGYQTENQGKQMKNTQPASKQASKQYIFDILALRNSSVL
jgi:hypothetical protein